MDDKLCNLGKRRKTNGGFVQETSNRVFEIIDVIIRNGGKNESKY